MSQKINMIHTEIHTQKYRQHHNSNYRK